jgi:hypothetical protein
LCQLQLPPQARDSPVEWSAAGREAEAEAPTPGTHHGSRLVAILKAVWEAADYPWSARLKALLSEWMPWIRRRFPLTPETEGQLLAISARTIDNRLGPHKRRLRRRIPTFPQRRRRLSHT